MRNLKLNNNNKLKISIITIIGIISMMISSSTLYAIDKSGEKLYSQLLSVMKGKGDPKIIYDLNTKSRELKWDDAKKSEFDGNLRYLIHVDCKGRDDKGDIYLIRETTGRIYILTLPEDASKIESGAEGNYAGLHKMLENKMVFKINVIEAEMDGKTYSFAKFLEKPTQLFFDKIFKILSIVMLFSVMIGMGLALTIKDFTLVFKSPKGMILGTILQFGMMPLIAVGVGHLFGYYETFPFLYVGAILVTATPGGATSNLMTHFAKGDLALSISLTSTATALSLVFTPLILAVYCTNVPDVSMPVGFVMSVIFVMVLLPLIIGMSIRHKWHDFAKKAIPIFSALGLVAVLFMIITGILGNLDVLKFSLESYGAKGIIMIFLLTLGGIAFGIIIPKLFGINNYQTRAISMELGIRNVTLGMVIALLIQDHMGDFNSEMFIVNAAFALMMYVVGGLAVLVYKRLLPVDE